MKKEMLDLAEWVIRTAKAAGADEGKAVIYGQRFVSISYRERKPETIKEATQRQLYLDLYADGRYSNQSTSDVRPEALKDFISRSIAATKLLAKDPYRSLPDPKYYEGRADLDLGILDPSYEALTPEERHVLVKTIEESCLAEAGDKVVSVTASAYDSRSELVMLTSNGFEGSKESTYFQCGAQATLKDEGDRRPMGSNYASSVLRKGLPLPKDIGAGAAKRALTLLGGKKIKTEKLPVIIENRSVGRILYGFLSAMYGSNIQQKQSFLAEKKGQKIGSEKFTLISDPFIIGGLGSSLFDSDGFATKKRALLDAGVLKDFLVDWYYSRKLGWEPTTGEPTNLAIPPGGRSVAEIMKDLGRGILITDFIGGNSNSTTGDMSMGIIGRLFENGEPVQAVAEMNIAGNHLKFWGNLAEAANDPWAYSSLRMPSLVFTDVVVSGL